MPNSVDSRIVEMQFDNAKFEKNVNKTIKSLDRLNKSLELNNAGKGFERVEKAVNGLDFSKMEKSLSFLEYRFSALGMTSAKIIDKMTSKIGGLFKKIESNTIGQIKSGGMTRALKLEHASFMLEGILKNAEKVKDIMDNAVSPAVDGTAYGLDAAANAASQFVAAGLTDVDKLKDALTGISGVAAMTGRDYEEISRIFTKVAASGRMMGDTVMELSTRGINASAVLAEHLHKSIAEVEEMRKKGQINFQMFAEAMNEAYGEHAKKANDTFTGAMANMKAALSRIGADFATPYLNNMKDIFNALRLTINDVRKALAPAVEMYTEAFYRIKVFTLELLKNEKFVSLYKNTINSVVEIIRIFSKALSPIGEGFRRAFPQGMLGILSDAAQKIYDVLYATRLSDSALNDISDIVSGLFSLLKITIDIIKNLVHVSSPVLDILNKSLAVMLKLGGVIGKGLTQIAKANNIVGKLKGVLKIIGDIILVIIGLLIQAVSAIKDAIDAFMELPIVQEIFEDISDAVYDLAQRALPILAGAAGAVMTAFGGIIKLFKSGKINEFFTGLNEKVTDFYHAAKAGKGVLSAFTGIFKGGFKNLPKSITAFAKSVDYANETVSQTVKPGGILPGLHNLHKAFVDVGGALNTITDSIIKNAKAFGVGRGLIVGLSAALIALLGNGAKLASTFSKAFAGVPGLIKAMTSSLNAPLFEAKAKAIIIGLAVAIGALTLSLMGLTMVDADKLMNAAKAMSMLIGVMAIAGIAINKLGGGFEGFKSLGFSFISFAASIVVLSLALKQLESIDLDFWGWVGRLTALGIMMGLMGGIFIAITHFSKPFSIIMGSGFLLSFALSIKMIVSAFGQLASMPIDAINAALPALLQMMGKLALVMAACSMLSPFAGIGFLAIAGGLLLFMAGVNLIAEYLDPNKFYYVHTMLNDIYNAIKGWLVLFAIAALIGSIAKLIKQIGDTVGVIKSIVTQTVNAATLMVKPAEIAANALKTLASAAVIGTIAASIIGIALTVERLGKIDPNILIQGGIVVGIIAAAFTGILATLMALQKHLLGANAFLSGLDQAALSIAALIFSISISLKMLASIPEADLFKGAEYVVGIIVVVVGLVKIVSLLVQNDASFSMGIKTALAMSVLIGSLTLAIGLLSMVAQNGWASVIAASAAIGIICLGIAAICSTLSEVKFAPALAATLGITAMFVGLAVAFGLLQNVNFEAMLPNLVALGASIAVMSIIMTGLSELGAKAAIGAAALIGITLVVGGFAYIFTILQNIDFNAMLPNLIAIGAAVVVLSGIAIGLGFLGLQAAIGILALTAMGLIMYLFAEVAKQVEAIDGDRFIENLEKLGIAVGALTVIMLALGAFVTLTGGIGAIFLGIGMAVLMALAGVMELFALVGHGFAVSAQEIAVALTMLAPAITLMGQALQTFASLDFSGIVGNMLSLIGSIEALSLVSYDIDKVGFGLKLMATSLNELDGYVSRLQNDISLLTPYITSIKDNVLILTDSFTNLATILDSVVEKLKSQEFYKVVSSIAAYMKQYSEVEMTSVGTKMIRDISAGFSLLVEEETANMMSDFIAGLHQGAFDADDELTSLGAELAQYLIAGFRGPNGIRAHSPSEEGEDGTKDFVAGLKVGGEETVEDQKQVGEDIATNIVDKTNETFEESTPAVMQSLTDMVKSAKDGAQNALNNSPLVVKVKGEADEFLKKLGLDTGSGVFTSRGLSASQRKNAEAQDKIISDLRGYGSIDALTRAGQAGLVHLAHRAKTTSDALDAETSALGGSGGGNTGATKKNTKAKEENAEANEKKTKSIDEESEALNEETEAAAENEEEIRALAEQIEVVTEAYNTSLDTIGRADKFKMVKKQAQVMSDFWSKGLKGDGAWKTVQDVYRAYKAIDNSALTTTKVFKKGVYAYKESGKYLKKYKDTLLTSAKEIEKKVLKTGNTLAKVTNGQAKMFYKNGNTVEKMTIRLTKRAKNLGKQFAEARAFATALSQENISEKVLNTEKIEDFVYPLRKIQDLFVSRGSMPKAVQDYLGTIRYKLLELNDSMNMLAKNIDGVGSTWKSNAQNTAYVQDAFLSLAASLYDGSEAANEYATEQARLEFLMEHGLATEEEVAEHRESYISRITKALVEYKNTLQDTLQGSLDVWKEFDTKEEDAKTDFIKTIESQLAGYRQWGDMLMELSKRGLSFDIQKELTEAGVESFGKLKSLLSMTREELALFMVDYQQSQTAAERAANLAVAALANARTQATARAAEKSGKITQKQINESRKAAREIANNNKALARDQAIYHSMTKKQEQDYLKTLTKRQRAEYKAEKKAEKKLQKEREALAEQERARRAEKERVDGVLTSIKTLDDYFKMAEQYVKDTGVMTRMTEAMTKAFEPFKEDIKNITTYTGDATDAFMIFAETLDATGTEGLNYFEELAARVEKFKKEITDAVKNVSYLTTEFAKSSKMTTDTLYKNLYSNLVADTKAVYLMNQLSGKGYNQYVITDAINKWKSDRAAGLEYINTLVEAGQADVEAYNAALEEQVRLSAQIASSATSASASTVTRDQINQEIKRREEAVRKAQSEEEAAVKRVDEVREQLESTYAAKAEYDRKQLQIADEKARKKELKQKLKDVGKLSKAEEKEYKNLLKKYGGSYKGVNYFAQEMFEMVNYQWEIDTLTNELIIAQNEYGKAIENTAEKQRLLNEEYSVLYDYENKIKKATEALTKKVNLRIWFEKAAQSVDGLVNSMKALNKESDEYKYAQGEIARVLKDFSGAIVTYNVAGNFENIKKAAKGLKDPISNIEYGLLKFGETLIDVTNDSEEFFDALLKGLAEYQASLKSAIQSSSDFFSMFDGFKDKDNPLTATDYLEYADSQIKALNIWQDNLKKLADKGLDQQILEKFASQGLSSYEMVNAWANATSRQIGEYNDQWRRYNETVEKATNSALASIGAAGSKAGQAIQDAMVDAFRKGGAERIAKELTDAADLATTTKMIVTGIADGMNNAMPTIAKVAKDTGQVISTSLASPEVVSSITTSLGGTVSTATTTATSDMVNNFKMAVNSVNNLIDTEMNLHPVITPTVDTSRFDEAIARMNAAISNVQANAANASAAVEAARQSSTTNNNSSTTNNTTNVTFNQTNNSPKALDQVEIYRQTHNATVSMSGMIVGGQWR